MLSFPPLEAWDNQLQAVNFLALRNGKSVLCSITREVLERHFGPGARQFPMECFREHRAEIEAIAGRLMADGRVALNRSLVIGEGDATALGGRLTNTAA